MPFKSSVRGSYGPQGQKVIKGPLAPVWVTSGTLPGASTGAYSFQLQATDDSGDAPTYSLSSGSLNPGLTLSSTGLISGTATGSTNTATFTVRATDVNGSFTDSSTLTLVATLSVPITDYTAINNDGRTSFSYAALPSATTLLAYIQSFGRNGSSANDGSAQWNNGHAAISWTASPFAGNNYFTRQGRVAFLTGDGGADGPDWCVFNFDVINGNGDYDGNANVLAYFGGESSYSGGTGGVVGDGSVGKVWGFSPSVGWRKLYQLTLGTTSGASYTHANGGWFDTGGPIVGSGTGKYSDYNNLTITHVGFSV